MGPFAVLIMRRSYSHPPTNSPVKDKQELPIKQLLPVFLGYSWVAVQQVAMMQHLGFHLTQLLVDFVQASGLATIEAFPGV
jgi:hypothetical protein